MRWQCCCVRAPCANRTRPCPVTGAAAPETAPLFFCGPLPMRPLVLEVLGGLGPLRSWLAVTGRGDRFGVVGAVFSIEF